ncbi:hypothetical protein H6G81_20955 [Scytonema hofmannii FACHB-248]|uniref:Uncharacterized protein n=1 Tax=Scytonema hofmannii FACHB-248 TaxID=1842502 RepID=A0ABR8GTW5_9CYAN|nr:MULTISPECIES: hypothetical protein [Nostocales]MBD2606934.1 hypothetical protein [Scytonema hofmannii FACHB-248]
MFSTNNHPLREYCKDNISFFSDRTFSANFTIKKKAIALKIIKKSGLNA